MKLMIKISSNIWDFPALVILTSNFLFLATKTIQMLFTHNFYQLRIICWKYCVQNLVVIPSILDEIRVIKFSDVFFGPPDIPLHPSSFNISISSPTYMANRKGLSIQPCLVPTSHLKNSVKGVITNAFFELSEHVWIWPSC